MNFFKSLFGKKEPIKKKEEEKKVNFTNRDFWNWFEANNEKFFEVVKERDHIESDFFDKLRPKLDLIKAGYFFLTGIQKDGKAEIIITPDGTIENIVFVEELVACAPQMKLWQITALKQPSSLEDFSIEMNGYSFNKDNLGFYYNEIPDMPDEIDLVITHPDFTEEENNEITNGVYLLLDNTLGELNSLTYIDNLKVINTKDAEKEIIPLLKLKDFLNWREKEFVEKYDGVRANTEEDNHSSLQGTLANGKPTFVIVNSDLLNWEAKASHPWISIIELHYLDNNNEGLPDNDKTIKLLDKIEDELTAKLKDEDGYLNTGRQTSENVREIYFACNDFRKPSKVFYELQQNYKSDIKISFSIYKDKYWRSFERYRQ